MTASSDDKVDSMEASAPPKILERMSLRARRVFKEPYLGAQNVDETLSSVNSGSSGEFGFSHSRLELFGLDALGGSLESSDGSFASFLDVGWC